MIDKFTLAKLNKANKSKKAKKILAYFGMGVVVTIGLIFTAILIWALLYGGPLTIQSIK